MTRKDNSNDSSMNNQCSSRRCNRRRTTGASATVSSLPTTLLRLPPMVTTTEATSQGTHSRLSIATTTRVPNPTRHTVEGGSPHQRATCGTPASTEDSSSSNSNPSFQFPCRYYNKDETMSLINVIDEVLQILEED